MIAKTVKANSTTGNALGTGEDDADDVVDDDNDNDVDDDEEDEEDDDEAGEGEGDDVFEGDDDANTNAVVSRVVVDVDDPPTRPISIACTPARHTVISYFVFQSFYIFLNTISSIVMRDVSKHLQHEFRVKRNK